MLPVLSRRSFAAVGAGAALSAARLAVGAEPQPSPSAAPSNGAAAPNGGAPSNGAAASNGGAAAAGRGPIEAPFERDYPAPEFQPSWKRPQINRLLVQDFVIYAHSDLSMVQKLLEKESGLLHATINWGAGDWESALGAAAHMGRRDIAEYLLAAGARIDLFCAAMLGQLEAVRAFLTLEPKLIDAKGPHGFSLHFHAQVGGKQAEPVLDYLQSVKKIELRPNPFLMKPADAKSKS